MRMAPRYLKRWQTSGMSNRGNRLTARTAFMNFQALPTCSTLLSEKLRDVGQKPVGIKLVAWSPEELQELFFYMQKSGQHPDFITIDGSEGGTGASFYELADTVGLPIMTALPIVDTLLRQYACAASWKSLLPGNS